MLKKFITTGLALILINVTSVFALQRTEVELSKPVGGDILPGGGQILGGDVQTSIIFSKIIPFAITYTIRLAIALAVIALIVGGYQYLTAYGDEEKHKNAKKTIIYAVIGLILALTAFGIVRIITTLQIT